MESCHKHALYSLHNANRDPIPSSPCLFSHYARTLPVLCLMITSFLCPPITNFVIPLVLFLVSREAPCVNRSIRKPIFPILLGAPKGSIIGGGPRGATGDRRLHHYYGRVDGKAKSGALAHPLPVSVTYEHSFRLLAFLQSPGGLGRGPQ